MIYIGNCLIFFVMNMCFLYLNIVDLRLKFFLLNKNNFLLNF